MFVKLSAWKQHSLLWPRYQSQSLFVISCIWYWSRSNWTYIKQFLAKHRSHKTKWQAPERSWVLPSVLWNPFFYPLNTVKPQGIPSMSTACEFKHLKKRMILEIRVNHNSSLKSKWYPIVSVYVNFATELWFEFHLYAARKFRYH
jgi:hypothetical protein